jgi:hypothetical protein
VIDTVRFVYQIKPSLHQPCEHWYGVQTVEGGKQKSGLRFSCGGGVVHWVEVSLPRLIFQGDNSKLISKRSEIQRALRDADAIVSRFARLKSTDRSFKRIDLVWQFEVKDIPLFFLAHNEINHSEFRSGVARWRNANRQTGITWKAKEAKLRMYLKPEWKNSVLPRKRKIIRVELEMRYDRLRDRLNSGNDVTQIDLKKAYDVYRSCLLKLQPSTVPRLTDTNSIIIHLEREGIDVLSFVGRKRCGRTIADLRKQLAGPRLKEFEVDWNQLLPTKPYPRKAEPGKRPPLRIKVRRKKS